MPKLVERATYSGRAEPQAKGRRSRASDAQIEAWRALVRAFAAARAAQEQALSGTGLDLSEYDVLLTLTHGPPEGSRPTQLAQQVLLTKSGMTRVIERLEQRGLVERRACPLDRRGQFIGLTPSGRRVFRRAAPALLRSIAASLPLPAAELDALRRAGERIMEAATAHSAV